MIRTSTILVLLLTFLVTDFSYACDTHITITSQSEIDNFTTNYPDCALYTGQLTVTGDNITNLNGLSEVAFRGGVKFLDLPNLQSLDGLTLSPSFYGIIKFDNMPNLTSVSTFSAVSAATGIYLTDLPNLQSLSGFDNITSTNHFEIHNCPVLPNFSGLENFTSIEGGFNVSSCDEIQNLSGLDQLTSVGGLYFQHNDGLIDLTGAPLLTEIGTLDTYILMNPNLTSIDGLQGITSLGSALWILENYSLTNLNGLINVSSIEGNVFIELNPLESLQGLSNLTSIGGFFRLWGSYPNTFTDLNGLNNLQSIGGFLSILGHNSLQSLDGLESLTTIDGRLSLGSNNALTNIDGLQNLNPYTIQAQEGSGHYDLEIGSNPLLNLCSTELICEFLTIPDRTYQIQNNNPDVAGCNSVEEIETACVGVSVSEETALKNISVFPNPTANEVSIDLTDIAFQNLTLNIINTQGKELSSTLLSAGNIEYIDVSFLSPGIYTMLIRTETEMTFNRKLVIVK